MHQNVTLSPESIERLELDLRNMRHNVRSQLAQVTAAVVLAAQNPKDLSLCLRTFGKSPERIDKELDSFKEKLQHCLGISDSEAKTK